MKFSEGKVISSFCFNKERNPRVVVVVVLEKGEVAREVLGKFRLEVEGWLVEEHPSDHEFLASYNIPDICRECGWIKPNASVARARAGEILNALDEHRVTTEG